MGISAKDFFLSEFFARLTIISFAQNPSVSAHFTELVSACLFIPLDCPNTHSREAVNSVISKKKNNWNEICFLFKGDIWPFLPYTWPPDTKGFRKRDVFGVWDAHVVSLSLSPLLFSLLLSSALLFSLLPSLSSPLLFSSHPHTPLSDAELNEKLLQ